MQRARSLKIVIDEDTAETENKRAKALEIIINRIDNSVLRLIKNDNSPFEFMKELDQRYQEHDAMTIVNLRTKLSSLKIKNFKSAKAYTDEVTDLTVWLENAGDTVTPEQQYSFLLQGIQDNLKYDNVRAAASAILQINKADPEVA